MKDQNYFSPASPDMVASEYDGLFKSIITAGWNTESDGNVESPYGFFALVELPAHEGEFTELAEAVFEDDTEAIEQLRNLPRGWYFTMENSDGLIWVYEMIGELSAKHIFANRQAAFHEAWTDGIEGE